MQTSASMTLTSTKSDLQLKSRFLDPDSDVCRIAAKMLRIHSLVGVSHFAECCENRPVKSPKIPYSAEWKSAPEFILGSGSPSKVNHFFQLVGPIVTKSMKWNQWNRLITFTVVLHIDTQNESMNEWTTKRQTWLQSLCLRGIITNVKDKLVS